jgi:nucleoside-diphosphate-sugar epimerase
VQNSIKNKNVLVTGGCGFIGMNLVNDLLTIGAKVTVLDLPDAHWERLPKTVKQVKVDILQKSELDGVLKGIAVVYHLAARTDIDGKKIEDYRVNYEGTQNLIESAAKSGGLERFVFYSTQLVIGLFNETRFIDETEPYKTKTAYGESKIEGENVVKKYCAKVGMPFTIIRPTSVYGPWGEAPYKAFFLTIKSRRYFHVGKANNLVSWVYVKNLTNLTILASQSEEAKNQTYFGNDFHPYTMREIVDTIASYYKLKIPTMQNALITTIAYIFAVPKAIGINVPIYPFRLKNIKANYCYDIKKSIDIGYKPQYDLPMGIKETLDWYEERNYK